MTRRFSLACFAVLLLVGLGTESARAQSTPAGDDARCRALAEFDFSTLPDAPTQLTEARLVKDLGGHIPDMGAIGRYVGEAKLTKALGPVQPMCRVSGYVTPNVGFVLLLPLTRWNGKFLHVGCGGWCGSTTFVPGSCAQHDGYACVGTDMGHTGAGGLWSRNNLQAQVDFGYRATHVTTLAAKAIVERFYQKPASKSYFMGCSTGGYQALVEAQRFPWDFDGIIAGAPDMDESDLAVRGIWVKRNFLDESGTPRFSDADVRLIHDAVLALCDLDDGLKDGIVSAPYRCAFDPASLQCRAGKQDSCLSQQQVDAAKNIYGRPRTSKGVAFSPRGVFPGSELLWKDSFSDTWGDDYFKVTGLLSEPGKEWKYTDFDFDRDYQRAGIGLLYGNTNPDLRRFKEAGGKLISYQGNNDILEMPGAAFDYYETVTKLMGGREKTQDFYRLFAIPGMNHCGGGDGVFAFDYLSYLEAWVERGQAPDVMIGAHVTVAKGEPMIFRMPLDSSVPVAFTRPVYPYPSYPKYKGTGNPNDAANFGPNDR